MTTTTRRDFLRSTLTAAAGISAAAAATNIPTSTPGQGQAGDARSQADGGLIDTNVHLGHWPGRRLPHGDSAALAEKLRASGVTQAWAGSFDALLHKDLAAVNARLAEACATHGEGLFVPAGAINPTLTAWESDLIHCRNDLEMSLVRLYPGYHGYDVSSPLFKEALSVAKALELGVQVVVRLEDTRTQHPLLRTPDLDVNPLPGVLASVPGVRIELLNALRTVRTDLLLKRLADLGVRFEIATLEGVAGIERLLTDLPVENLCFGSHAPFFYFESALLKLKESLLSGDQLAAIRGRNAAQFLRG